MYLACKRDFILISVAAIAGVFCQSQFMALAYMEAFENFGALPDRYIMRLVFGLAEIVGGLCAAFVVLFPFGCLLVGQVYYCWLLFLCIFFLAISPMFISFALNPNGDVAVFMLSSGTWSFLLSALLFMYLGRIARRYIDSFSSDKSGAA